MNIYALLSYPTPSDAKALYTLGAVSSATQLNAQLFMLELLLIMGVNKAGLLVGNVVLEKFEHTKPAVRLFYG